MKTSYYLKKPGKKLRKFAIYSQQLKPDGRTKNVTLKNVDIASINEQLTSGKIGLAEATKQAEAVRLRLSGQTPQIFNKENDGIVERYLKDHFKLNPYIIDKGAAASKIKRAVRALGKFSLQACSYEEALEALLSNENSKRQRETAHKLNSLFKYLGREIRLPVAPKEPEDVIYITEQELNKIIPHFDEVLAAGVKASFYGGLRVGELLAGSFNPLLADGSIKVDWQIDSAGKKRLPKNKKRRKAFIHDRGADAYRAFINRSKEYEPCTRHMLNKRFQKVCKRILNRSDLKWHDLRHSYAVFLLGLGVPLDLLAQSMGNSSKVCQESYAGFVLSDAGIDTIKRFMSGS